RMTKKRRRKRRKRRERRRRRRKERSRKKEKRARRKARRARRKNGEVDVSDTPSKNESSEFKDKEEDKGLFIN
ncbi:hypothetical protein OFM52_29740, partial [Escherichia coli]|nr:hypothetical protein [Escherichia coli]